MAHIEAILQERIIIAVKSPELGDVLRSDQPTGNDDDFSSKQHICPVPCILPVIEICTANPINSFVPPNNDISLCRCNIDVSGSVDNGKSAING